MKPSSKRFRRVLWLGGTAASAVALLVAAVTTSVAAQPTSLAGTTAKGPGYPPPKGVYSQYTNCPLNNPLMHEAITVTVCTAGLAKSGSITIGNITTPVTQPVNVQFGWYDSAPVAFDWPLPTVSPLAGPSAILSTKPDLIPVPLTTELGCATATDPTVQHICQQAAANPADNQVFALAQEVAPVTNFNLFTWTQPVIFKLINPLLGSNCTIGTPDAPVVLNPRLMGTSGTTFNVIFDPQPTVHPDVAQILVGNALATDTTFSAPGVSGCGPGGVANIAVETALDAGAGLPAASGANSLTLFGNFDLAIGAGPENFPQAVPQPADGAAELLAAFKASTNGEHSVKHLVSESQVKAMFHLSG